MLVSSWRIRRVIAGNGELGARWAESTVAVDLRRADGSTIIEVKGELDLASAPRLRDGLVQARATHDGIALELDLSGVDFVDRAGGGR